MSKEKWQTPEEKTRRKLEKAWREKDLKGFDKAADESDRQLKEKI